MAKLKRASDVLEKAQKRHDGISSIDTKLDFGDGVSVAAYGTAIGDLGTALAAYNTALSTVDGLLNQVKAKESSVRDLSERMLTGVATKFGKDSDQYEKAGGKKKSERKRPKKKTA